MSDPEPAYDEAEILQRLTLIPTSARVAFASAMAEFLFPSYQLFSDITGHGQPAALRQALDRAWSVAEDGASPGADDAAAQAAAESLVPSDDDETWHELSPLAQNAAAAVAYAVRVWITDDAQEGVWAARQAYEAADFLVQSTAPAHTYVDAEGEQPLVIARAAIDAALAAAATQPAARLRHDAAARGQQFAQLVRPES